MLGIEPECEIVGDKAEELDVVLVLDLGHASFVFLAFHLGLDGVWFGSGVRLRVSYENIWC